MGENQAIQDPPRIWVSLLLVLLAATAAHLAFSSFGFNPSDDGFILAGSRRVLDGQVPHRDFISIRPAGSYYLHAPIVWFGGSYTIWLSRWFVWLELMLIAWLGFGTLQRLFRVTIPAWVMAALSLLAACFGAHSFAILAWHSIDALLFSLLGFALISRESPSTKLAGYLIMGLAPLCRQNFLLVPLAAVILTSDWRQWRCWSAALLPTGLMLLLPALFGAWNQFWAQLTAQAGIYAAGIEPYLTSIPFRKGIIVGALGALLLIIAQRFVRRRAWHWTLAIVGLLLLWLTPALAISYLYEGRFVWKPCMRLLGAATGCSIVLLATMRERRQLALPLLFTLFLAWSVAISIGYQTIALASGVVATMLILSSYLLVNRLESGVGLRRWSHALSIVVAVATLFAFIHTRRSDIYRDRPARELTMPVGEVLSCGELLYTNPATYEFMADLDRARALVQSERYAIMPDFACHWIDSRQPNPLPVDWVQSTELATPELVARIRDALESQRGELTVIVQKISGRFVAREILPLPRSDRYEAVNYVIDNWTPVDETEYFQLFR